MAQDTNYLLIVGKTSMTKSVPSTVAATTAHNFSRVDRSAHVVSERRKRSSYTDAQERIAVSEQAVTSHDAPSDGTPSAAAHTRTQFPLLGLTAALISVFLSGFAGVYFEKILKGADISVWLRNVQLSVLSIPMSLIAMYAKDGDFIRDHGMLYGYDGMVWSIVVLYAVGGLSVAVVVKYADNILKGFATSISILLTCVASVYLFDFSPSLAFLAGTSLVIGAVFLYSKPSGPLPDSGVSDPAASRSGETVSVDALGKRSEKA